MSLNFGRCSNCLKYNRTDHTQPYSIDCCFNLSPKPEGIEKLEWFFVISSRSEETESIAMESNQLMAGWNCENGWSGAEWPGPGQANWKILWILFKCKTIDLLMWGEHGRITAHSPDWDKHIALLGRFTIIQRKVSQNLKSGNYSPSPRMF